MVGNRNLFLMLRLTNGRVVPNDVPLYPRSPRCRLGASPTVTSNARSLTWLSARFKVESTLFSPRSLESSLAPGVKTENGAPKVLNIMARQTHSGFDLTAKLYTQSMMRVLSRFLDVRMTVRPRTPPYDTQAEVFTSVNAARLYDLTPWRETT